MAAVDVEEARHDAGNHLFGDGDIVSTADVDQPGEGDDMVVSGSGAHGLVHLGEHSPEGSHVVAVQDVHEHQLGAPLLYHCLVFQVLAHCCLSDGIVLYSLQQVSQRLFENADLHLSPLFVLLPLFVLSSLFEFMLYLSSLYQLLVLVWLIVVTVDADGFRVNLLPTSGFLTFVFSFYPLFQHSPMQEGSRLLFRVHCW